MGAELPGDFREGEREVVVFECDHGRVGRKGSPVAIANLAGDGGDAFGGQAPHRAQEFRDHGGTFADDFEQIARNLPGQREERIGVFTQFPGQTADGLFARRRLLPALDLAQVGRLDATRPATWRREKVGSFSTWAIRLARKVSPKERSPLMVWCGCHTSGLRRQAAGFASEDRGG